MRNDNVIPFTLPGLLGAEPGPYEDEDDPPSWQRVATLLGGHRILITVWDNDPDTIEVLVRAPDWDRWSSPLTVTEPPS